MNIGTLAQIACILEATARKPGNVHREADFAGDAHYLDFLLSATAIAEPMNRAREIGVGATVLAAVKSTREVVSTNTNLGIILLMAPVACVAEGDLQEGVGKVLGGLTVEDARLVYQAIRLAGAGGMGEVAEQDLREEPTVTLLEAMRLASGRDMVARQYVTGYEDVFGITVPALFVGEAGRLTSPLSKGGLRGVGFGAEVGLGSSEFPPPNPPFQRGGMNTLESAIVWAYLVTLANRPDSLIARKRGEAVGVEASRRAAEVLAGGEIAEFDAWLREDGHARNPGATADLVAAALFVALLDGTIQLPGKGSGWDGLKPQRS